MKPVPQLILSPRQLETFDTLVVRSATSTFNEYHYIITDDGGKIMRKGTIHKAINEFKLCIVGFKSGQYHIHIGEAAERFTVL